MDAGASGHVDDEELGLEAYRELVEGVPVILYMDRPDETSTNVFTSPQALELLGYTPEEWGTSLDLWFRTLHPDDVERVRRENDRSNSTGEPFRSEYRMFAKDGRILWLRDEAVLVRDAEGVPSHWRGVILDITAQKEAEERLRWSLDALRRTVQERRELAQRLERAREEERRRIAADIHDDPIQVMSAVDLRLQLLARDGAVPSPETLDELAVTVRRSIERLRSLVFELRPTALDRDGLVATLRLYLDHAAVDAGWTPVVHDGLHADPSPELRTLLYRSFQEAVTNVRKHARATRIDVVVERARGGITLRVQDDGVGFDVAEAMVPRPGHMGLTTMIERAELLGGWCRVSSSPGEGALVECWLPEDPSDGVETPGA
jgi:PAS domain S-box-containing protein